MPTQNNRPAAQTIAPPTNDVPLEWIVMLARIDERTANMQTVFEKHIEQSTTETKELRDKVTEIERELADRDTLKKEFQDLKKDHARLEGQVSTMATTSSVNQTWASKVWDTIKLPASILVGFLVLSYAEAENLRKAPQAVAIAAPAAPAAH